MKVSTRRARVGLVAAIAALVPHACKPTAGPADAQADAAPEDPKAAFVPRIPDAATLPGDFSPPKDPWVAPPPLPPTSPWFGFEPFPGAELLCGEEVAMAKSGKLREIHWATYGVTTPVADVLAFYRRRDAGTQEVDRDEVTFVVGKSQKLSVVRLPTSQPFPRCERTPKPSYKGIIVVSRAEGHPGP